MKKNRVVELLTMTDGVLDKKVKIQGTEYDRKRKISKATVTKMKRMAKKKSISEIAREFGISYTGVRYNIDPEFKAWHNANRDGKHTGKDHVTKTNRVAYKRGLVAAGKVTA